MKELSINQAQDVNGGMISWNEAENAILGLGLVGLTVGTGGVGLFGLAIWGAMAYVD